MNDPETLAKAHWGYVASILKTHGESEEVIEKCGHHYITAFVHGWKHAKEDMNMKLFLISQDKNNDYDTYDSAVVAAPDAETARNINPGIDKGGLGAWCSSPEYVTVRYLGEAGGDIEQGVVCASFNAW